MHPVCSLILGRLERFFRAVLITAFFGLSIAGCSTPQSPSMKIDPSIVSVSQDSRVRFLVAHYTAQPLERSLELLTKHQVSAHYLVPDRPETRSQEFRVYQLVPEPQRAWHAGVSSWQGSRLLNASSVGVEIINLGYPAEDQDLPVMQRRWYPYSPAQIEVIAKLFKKIIDKHQISPYNVVGHNDIAPGRKFDPGPLFPWERLYKEYGIGAWPDDQQVVFYERAYPYRGNIVELQNKLAKYGYDLVITGVLDPYTIEVISSFQMHFRPRLYDGIPDTETVARLDALLDKYFKVKPK